MTGDAEREPKSLTPHSPRSQQVEMLRIRRCGMCRQPLAGDRSMNGEVVAVAVGVHLPGCPWANNTVVVEGEVVGDATS